MPDHHHFWLCYTCYYLESQCLHILSSYMLHLWNYALPKSHMLILKSSIKVKEFTGLICMALLKHWQMMAQLLQQWLRSDKKTSTLAAVSLFPSRAYVVKVSIEMITGVVAQKYTHQASRYFLPFRLFNSAALEKLHCIKVKLTEKRIVLSTVGIPKLRYM